MSGCELVLACVVWRGWCAGASAPADAFGHLYAGAGLLKHALRLLEASADLMSACAGEAVCRAGAASRLMSACESLDRSKWRLRQLPIGARIARIAAQPLWSCLPADAGGK